MEDKIVLSVVIVGDGSGITPYLRASLEAMSTTRGVEALFIATDVQDGLPNVPAPHCSIIPAAGWSFRECITRALEHMKGDWVVILHPHESLLPESFDQLVKTLQGSTHGVRHGNTTLVDEYGNVKSHLKPEQECTYPLLARWWLNAIHPHESALFMRKHLVVRALHNTDHHNILTRYAISLGTTRCCSSKGLGFSASTAPFNNGDTTNSEVVRLDVIRQEITVHSLLEQSTIWRDYYISRLTEAHRHTTPTLLPYSRAQAHALASLLGEVKIPMAELLWKLYQDISLSKRAVVYLSCWSSITSVGAAKLSGSPHDAPLRDLLSEELKNETTTNILLLTQSLTESPLASLVQLLRDEGRHGATVYTVSYNEDEYRPLFADLADRGLLGWIRPAITTKLRPPMPEGQQPSDTLINEFNLAQRIPQRTLTPILDNSQNTLDYVIGHIDDPFITAEVSHLAENVTSPHSIILLGRITASTLGPIEATIRRYRQVASINSHSEVTVVRCEALQRPL